MRVSLETKGNVPVDNEYNTLMFYPSKEDSAAPEVRLANTNIRY